MNDHVSHVHKRAILRVAHCSMIPKSMIGCAGINVEVLASYKAAQGSSKHPLWRTSVSDPEKQSSRKLRLCSINKTDMRLRCENSTVFKVFDFVTVVVVTRHICTRRCRLPNRLPQEILETSLRHLKTHSHKFGLTGGLQNWLSHLDPLGLDFGIFCKTILSPRSSLQYKSPSSQFR